MMRIRAYMPWSVGSSPLPNVSLLTAENIFSRLPYVASAMRSPHLLDDDCGRRVRIYTWSFGRRRVQIYRRSLGRRRVRIYRRSLGGRRGVAVQYALLKRFSIRVWSRDVTSCYFVEVSDTDPNKPPRWAILPLTNFDLLFFGTVCVCYEYLCSCEVGTKCANAELSRFLLELGQ